MKKTLYTLVFLCLASFAMAQERKEIGIRMSLGDTVVWTPFDDCDTMISSLSNTATASESLQNE